jgi:serine protease AprX
MRSSRALRAAAALAVFGVVTSCWTAAAVAAEGPATATSVIVQAIDAGGVPAIDRLVRKLHGTVDRELPVINAVAATVPADAVAALASTPAVRAVTPNLALQLFSDDDEEATEASGMPTFVSMAAAMDATGAAGYVASGLTGQGVDIALVDSGVTRVHGLDAPGKVVDGPDFSTESLDTYQAHIDQYGHGTHMAGIIAGADTRQTDAFSGMAPGARLINLKVADKLGRTDVSLVIAAIGWAVDHRAADGFNIKVLNLSFGTDGGAEPALDPLDQAVEVAWRHGVTVIAAAGNHGAGAGHLANPARDPLVLAVGAVDSLGSRQPTDGIALDFSSHGDGSRNPDLVAPGRSIASLRSPGSYVDRQYEQARVNDRLLRGSGTSQAAAMVSGAVALVAQQHPEASPEQIKALLNETAVLLPKGGDATEQGHGLLDLEAALGAPLPTATVAPIDPTPDGHIVAAGSDGSVWHIAALAGAVVLSFDPFSGYHDVDVHTDEVSGDWDGSSWSGSSWSEDNWSGSSWSSDAW